MFALCSVLSKVLRNKLAMMMYDVAIALILCFPDNLLLVLCYILCKIMLAITCIFNYCCFCLSIQCSSLAVFKL